MSIRWELKAFYQRRVRGFDDSELWSLDHTILEFILPRLKRFREKARHGWPGPESIFGVSSEYVESLSEETRANLDQCSIDEWNRMLDKMIRAIQLQIEYGGIFIKDNPEYKDGDTDLETYVNAPELEAEYKEGWALFIEWFHALWD